MANARATQSANIDTAMATVVSNIPAWIGAGGSAGILVRSLLACLAASDPALGRYIERKFGSSSLVGVQTTVAAADTSP